MHATRNVTFMTAATRPPLRDVAKIATSVCRFVLAVVALVGLLSSSAQAFHQYFDLNGTTAGSGVIDGGSYTWEGAKWNNNNAAGTAATIAWSEGAQFARFAAGTDANFSNYTVTAGSSHTFAGMLLQADGGGTVTIASSGGAVLTFSSNSGGQGMYVGGINTQNLVVTAPIGGDAVTPLVWQGAFSGTAGTLSLYGNNTFAGGVNLNTSANLNFNNANSFGTGHIRWGTATTFTLSAPALSSALTITNPMDTKAASTLTMTEFAKPVTWSGAWTLASGTSTLDIRNNANTTISGVISGATGALTKISTGTLTLTGANTYGGATTISNGTVELSGAAAKLGPGNVTVTGTGSFLTIDNGVTDGLNNAGTLSVASGGLLNLAAGVNERVAALSLESVFHPNGTYGSSQSNAVNKFDEFFSGTGILTVGPAILAGDYNSDGTVNAADYVVWKKNIGQPSQTLPNDTTGVIVGQPQYDLWRSNFGSTTAVPGSGAVEIASAIPEPSSVALLTLGFAAFVAFAMRPRTNGISRE
jgi:autotransporter-associated beta strand protein